MSQAKLSLKDRTTDKDDLVQPGIIQLELRVGQLYVFPDFVVVLRG